MTFNKLGLEPDNCDCLQKAFQDTNNLYSRRIKQPTVETGDFKTKWEDGKGKSEFDCKKICDNLKSLSINLWNSDESNKKAMEKYVAIWATNRPREDAALIFKFSPNSGLVKLYDEDDLTHYGFFKSDEFDLNYLTTREIIILSETNAYKESEKKRHEKRK